MNIYSIEPGLLFDHANSIMAVLNTTEFRVGLAMFALMAIFLAGKDVLGGKPGEIIKAFLMPILVYVVLMEPRVDVVITSYDDGTVEMYPAELPPIIAVPMSVMTTTVGVMTDLVKSAKGSANHLSDPMADTGAPFAVPMLYMGLPRLSDLATTRFIDAVTIQDVDGKKGNIVRTMISYAESCMGQVAFATIEDADPLSFLIYDSATMGAAKLVDGEVDIINVDTQERVYQPGGSTTKMTCLQLSDLVYAYLDDRRVIDAVYAMIAKDTGRIFNRVKNNPMPVPYGFFDVEQDVDAVAENIIPGVAFSGANLIIGHLAIDILRNAETVRQMKSVQAGTSSGVTALDAGLNNALFESKVSSARKDALESLVQMETFFGVDQPWLEASLLYLSPIIFCMILVQAANGLTLIGGYFLLSAYVALRMFALAFISYSTNSVLNEALDIDILMAGVPVTSLQAAMTIQDQISTAVSYGAKAVSKVDMVAMLCIFGFGMMMRSATRGGQTFTNGGAGDSDLLKTMMSSRITPSISGDLGQQRAVAAGDGANVHGDWRDIRGAQGSGTQGVQTASANMTDTASSVLQNSEQLSSTWTQQAGQTIQQTVANTRGNGAAASWSSDILAGTAINGTDGETFGKRVDSMLNTADGRAQLMSLTEETDLGAKIGAQLKAGNMGGAKNSILNAMALLSAEASTGQKVMDQKTRNKITNLAKALGVSDTKSFALAHTQNMGAAAKAGLSQNVKEEMSAADQKSLTEATTKAEQYSQVASNVRAQQSSGTFSNPIDMAVASRRLQNEGDFSDRFREIADNNPAFSKAFHNALSSPAFSLGIRDASQRDMAAGLFAVSANPGVFAGLSNEDAAFARSAVEKAMGSDAAGLLDANRQIELDRGRVGQIQGAGDAAAGTASASVNRGVGYRDPGIDLSTDISEQQRQAIDRVASETDGSRTALTRPSEAFREMLEGQKGTTEQEAYRQAFPQFIAGMKQIQQSEENIKDSSAYSVHSAIRDVVGTAISDMNKGVDLAASGSPAYKAYEGAMETYKVTGGDYDKAMKAFERNLERELNPDRLLNAEGARPLWDREAAMMGMRMQGDNNLEEEVKRKGLSQFANTAAAGFQKDYGMSEEQALNAGRLQVLSRANSQEGFDAILENNGIGRGNLALNEDQAKGIYRDLLRTNQDTRENLDAQASQMGYRVDGDFNRANMIRDTAAAFNGTMPELMSNLAEGHYGAVNPMLTRSSADEYAGRLQSAINNGSLSTEDLAKILPNANLSGYGVDKEDLSKALVEQSGEVGASSLRQSLNALEVGEFGENKLNDSLGSGPSASSRLSDASVDRFKDHFNSLNYDARTKIAGEMAGSGLSEFGQNMDMKIGEKGGDAFNSAMQEYVSRFDSPEAAVAHLNSTAGVDMPSLAFEGNRPDVYEPPTNPMGSQGAPVELVREMTAGMSDQQVQQAYQQVWSEHGQKMEGINFAAFAGNNQGSLSPKEQLDAALAYLGNSYDSADEYVKTVEGMPGAKAPSEASMDRAKGDWSKRGPQGW